jgi:photosystem II stability/assembly factor-like uncharacterized protein
MTLNGGKDWQEMSSGLMGARVQNFVASAKRTFVLHAETDRGVFLSRDGGMSWRPAAAEDRPTMPKPNFKDWQRLSDRWSVRINDGGELVRSGDSGKTAAAWMIGWRIPRANSFFLTARGLLASGPGGCYLSRDGENWNELKLWREEETGAADFLHAYWMGRYYGFIGKDE